MKKLLFIIFILIFLFYLYNLGLKNIEMKQARIEMTNDKIDISLEKGGDNNINQQDSINSEISDDKNLYNLDNVTYKKTLIGTENNGLFMGLPEGDLFGQVVSLENGDITYSNIKDLFISKKEFDNELLKDSNNIWNSEGTGYLNSNEFSSYIYWNSLRPIDINNKQAGNSFYILEKIDDKFVYSKLYFDFNHKLFGKLKIQEFIVKEGDISEQMKKINKSLKEKNQEFDVVKKTDFLFKEIIR